MTTNLLSNSNLFLNENSSNVDVPQGTTLKQSTTNNTTTQGNIRRKPSQSKVQQARFDKKKDLENPPLIPIRNETTKAIAQDCVQYHRKGGVYIKHFRKASGTSLYGIMRDHVCSKDIPTYSSEFPFFNSDTFHKLGTSVFLTILRHPIDRIESLYWFEGRWPRTCSAKCEAEKIKDDTNLVAELDDWIEHVHDQANHSLLALTRHSSCGMWQSVENYYIRMLVGIDRPQTRSEVQSARNTRGFMNRTITRRHLQRAKEILASFDLVVIQEYLQEQQPSTSNSKLQAQHVHSKTLFPQQDMIRMLYSITGSDKPYKTTVRQLRKGKERSSSSYRPMTEAARNRLEEWNALDIELYEYAVELSKRTVMQWAAKQQQQQQQQQQENALGHPLKHPSGALSMDDSNGTVSMVTTQDNTSLSVVNPRLCQKPPKTLPTSSARIALGGPGCRVNPSWFYMGRQCLLHSHEAGVK